MKSRSITKRLFIEIVLVVLSFSGLILLANTLLLKPLYYYSVERTMIEAMGELTQIDYYSDSLVWEEAINRVNRGGAYDITIESNEKIIYSSSLEFGIKGPSEFDRQPSGDFRTNKQKEPFFQIYAISDWKEVEEGLLIGTIKEPKSNTELYACMLTMDDGTVIYLTQAIEPILNSVKQANILLLVGTLFFLPVIGFMAFRLSKRFTEPVKKMQFYVGKLSRLDFSGECKVETGDELQNLSTDINQLSKELQKALATLQAQNIQLEREIKSQRKFISNASHELRTPLSLIKGYADEISSGFVNDVEQERKYVQYIAEESSKMKRLLNEILELSRLESGRMTLRYETLSVKELVESFVEKYTGFIEEHKLEVTLDLKEVDGYLDPIRFEQILANYLSNGAKYSDRDKKVRISLEVKDDLVRVNVYNSGLPIEKSVVDYIWDGFYKADEARIYKEGSYGLGLSVVKAIQSVTKQQYGVYNTEAGVIFWFDVAKA